MNPESHRQGAPWRWFLLSAALFVAAAPVFAQATYTYQGNNYETIEPGTVSLDTSMRVSGSFDLTLALPPNLAFTGIDGATLTGFSFSNGSITFTPSDSEICSFEVATGPSGQIVQWNIALRQAGIPAGADQQTVTTYRVVSAIDQGDIVVADSDPCSDTVTVKEFAKVEDNPGVWTSDAAGVPLMPIWGLVILSALVAVAGGVTLRARQQA